jgi:hypothetical protein
VNLTWGRLLPRRRSSLTAGTLQHMRIASVIAASLAGLLSIGLLAAGGLLLWGDSKKDDQGYISTASHRFATDRAGLATDNLDLDLDGLDTVVNRDHYGTIRLQVDPRTDKPMFIGIAPTQDVERYLHDTSHALVTDISYSPFHAHYAAERGSARPAAPAAQGFWSASAHGTGRQTLTWHVDEGDWSVVVMNEDGSRGVDAGVRAGADVPWLDDLAWGVTIAGVVMLLLATGFTVVAVRAKPRIAVPA